MHRALGLAFVLMTAAFARGEDSAAPAAAALPGVTRPASAMNEMRGSLLSVGSDPKIFRLTVDGGYNVEFSWDRATQVLGAGAPRQVSDLDYGDKVIVRYAGKELYAAQVERTQVGDRVLGDTAATPPAAEAPVAVSTPAETSTGVALSSTQKTNSTP